MAMQQPDPSASIASRVQYLDDRIGYADFEIERNVRWRNLLMEMAEEHGMKSVQWEEEKQRCESERTDLFGALRQAS